MNTIEKKIFELNNLLNKALIGKNRIKNPDSNKIAEFVNQYISETSQSEKNENSIEVILREKLELHECKEGTKIHLIFYNDEAYSGIFNGFDGDDTILLKSVEKETIIGLPFNMLSHYLEE